MPFGSEPFFIDVDVTNIGRRPISIVEVFYEQDAKEREYPIRTPIHGGFVDISSPVELAENQTRRFRSKDISLKELLESTKVFTVGVIDSKGKLYKTSIENVGFYVPDEDLT